MIQETKGAIAREQQFHRAKHMRPALNHLRETFGRNMNQTRLAQRMTLRTLSELSLIPLEKLDKLEMGMGEIKLHHLSRIAHALNTKPADLLK